MILLSGMIVGPHAALLGISVGVGRGSNEKNA